MEIELSNSSCEWRLTPWDSRVFGFPTSEIKNINYQDNGIRDLLLAVDDINMNSNIQMTYFRHNANDQKLKKVAIEHNYQIKEFSFYTYHNNVMKIPKAPLKLEFQRAGIEHLEEIQRIAMNSFQHGRFHEDPFIPYEWAQKRYENWIADLISTDFYIFRIKNQIGGFFCYTKKDGEIDMPISGLSQDALKLGGFLWVNMFHFISELENTTRIRNLISGANTAVVNLYARLGFSFDEPLFGYHKTMMEADLNGK